jgi:hypothetical protein
MSKRETGKLRSSRIELGYYKSPDAFARWRTRLTVLALALAGLWFGLAPVWTAGRANAVRLFQWDTLASPGPLARAHSTWESRCQACHVPFRPINGSRWSPLLSADTRVSDQQCQTCHAGPPHHASQIAGEVAACAECHRDHRGPEMSLVRVEDSDCTHCHADLKNHIDKNVVRLTPAVAEIVTHFDENAAHHPEFGPVKRPDPGRLKFNHALHQAKGFTLQKGGKEFTFAQVAATDRERYGWLPSQTLESAVPTLKCASCHELESDENAHALRKSPKAGGVTPPRNAGAYMMPVTYENHCRACHSLEFDARAPERQVRHRLEPRDVIADLRQFYAAQAVEADTKLLDRFVPSQARPGFPAEPQLERVRRKVDDKVLTALKILFGSHIDDAALRRHDLPMGRRGCVECHHLIPDPGPLISAGTIAKVAIEGTNVPRVWFERAAFDHSAHQAVDCLACHSAAKASENSTDVLVPGINNCIQCHGQARETAAKATGGAGDSCTECHRYHNGDQPLQGIGAPARGVENGRTIEQFVKGLRETPSH